MARKLRVEFPGAVYHVSNRGDRDKPIFRSDADRVLFLDILAETCRKTGWQVHALCLMPNHFHLVLETPGANLVPGMKWFLGAYTSRFNRRHNLSGRLFGGRYKSLFVEGGAAGYLKTACDYVHLNPARAGLLTPRQKLSRYRWSSYPAYLLPPGRRPFWLRVDRLLEAHGLPRDTEAARRQFALRMEARRSADLEQEWKAVRRGWCLGGKGFRRDLLKKMRHRTGPIHGVERPLETEQAWAEHLVTDELKRRRWTAADLRRRRKSDGQKLEIARRLRQETTMTVNWITQRLHMGAASSLANLLRHGPARKNGHRNRVIH